MRIYLEIARDVRKKVGPDMAVTIRLSGTDYEPDGFPIEDTIELAKALEKEGIDAFHISGGDHHTMIHQVSPMAINVIPNGPTKPAATIPRTSVPASAATKAAWSAPSLTIRPLPALSTRKSAARAN